MQIRQANQDDALYLAQLIFASAPQTLAAIFTVNHELSAENFLLFSCSTAGGQYGYTNHWVAELDNQVVGCLSAWSIDLPNSFHLQTLAKLTAFYGADNSMSVLHTSQVLQNCIPKPKKHELCIGHFAVLPEYQRQGVASKLLTFSHKQALLAGKSSLSLDVESTNLIAIKFYLEQGFVQQNESDISPRMKALGIGSYLHLSKKLI